MVVGPTNLNNTIPQYLTSRLGYVFVDDWGAVGDGTTDDTSAIILAEASRTSGQILRGTPGKTYATSSGSLLKIQRPGTWDFRNATIKYIGAGNLTTGGDGGAYGVVNSLASGTIFYGTIDGGGKAAYPIALNSLLDGFRIDATFQAVRETSGMWSGIAYGLSQDISGSTISGRAINVSGFVSRLSCPIINTSGTIVGHEDVSAVLCGGQVVNTNSTGFALVSGGEQWNAYLAKPDTLGIMQTPAKNEGNDHWMDLVVHDVGANVLEIYGHSNSSDSNWGLGQNGGNIGAAFKTGCMVGFYYDNATQITSNAPNVLISGGSTQSSGSLRLYGAANFQQASVSLRTTSSSASVSNLSAGELALVNVSTTSAQLAWRSGNTTYVFNAIQASP